MGILQWDCLYKNSHSLHYTVSVESFSLKETPSTLSPSIFLSLFTMSLLGKKGKRNKPRILASFQIYSGELLSEGVSMETHPWTRNGNSGTDHFELFMTQSTLTF